MSNEELALTKEQLTELGQRCWRSPSEFCRVFLPGWFPSKMPWFHRGLLAMRTGQTDFLLDFGEEWWPEDVGTGQPSRWTADDLVKIITNFVYPRDPGKPDQDLVAIFSLEFDAEGNPARVVIDETDNNAFIIPRGFSKTTLENAANLRDLLYKAEPFILYVSEAAEHAEAQLSTIRRQLEENDLIIGVFGNLQPSRQSTDKWTDSLIELTNGMKAGAVGSGGQVRGKSKDAQRPTRIVVDDFQTREGVKVDAQRKKDLAWFMGTLMPARQLFGAKRSRVDMIGTLLHKEAVLNQLKHDPEWRVVHFGAIDRDGDPLWAYALDKDKLERIRQSNLRLGTLDEFELEYMSNSVDEKSAAFPMDKLNIVRREEDWYVAKALTMDPAISTNPKADFCAFAVVGIGQHGRLHVQDTYEQVGMDPADQVEKVFELYFAHLGHLHPDMRKVGVEAVAYQRSLLYAINAKQHEKSQTWGDRAYFEVIPILHGKTGKIARVQGLIKPRWRSGHISFERKFTELESQLRDWPNGKLDCPDVVAMAIQLLDPFAPLNLGEDVEVPRTEERRAKLPPVHRFRKAP